jgi:hypothetical protein
MTGVLYAAIPAASSNLDVRLLSDQIHVVWQDNSSNESDFLLQCKVDSGSWANLIYLNKNTTSYQYEGYSINHAYYFRVASQNCIIKVSSATNPNVYDLTYHPFRICGFSFNSGTDEGWTLAFWVVLLTVFGLSVNQFVFPTVCIACFPTLILDQQVELFRRKGFS